MMDRTDRNRGKGFFRMQGAWKKAVAMTFLGTVACSPLALADFDTPVKFIRYESYQDPMFDPSYTIAWDAMADLYKGSEYEKGKVGGQNPYLSVGQVDLNGDRMSEIIARPEPAEPESVELCTPVNQICPFYILEVRDNTVINLGIIKAATIDRGDDIENGYWTLKVYGRTESGDNYTGPVVYAYDNNKRAFAPKPLSPSTP